MARLNTSMSPKFTDEIIVKLRTQKILTVFDFIKESVDKLIVVTGLHFKEILEIREQMLEIFGGKVKNPLQLLANQSEILSTGIPSLDNLLRGGLYSGQIYEICGQSSAGKSQLCHMIAANVSTKSDGIIHYINVVNNFSGTRVHMILSAKGLNAEEIGKRMCQIKVTTVTTIPGLLCELYKLTHSLKTNSTCKLLIIDSLPLLFIMSQENHENLYSLNHFTSVCHFLTSEYSLPIITVNLITKWQDCEFTLGSSSATVLQTTSAVKPLLGKYWSHIPNTRLFIEHTENEKRTITVWKSGYVKIGSKIEITINDQGII